MYFRQNNSVFEDIGNNIIRCIASYRRKMIGVLMINSTQSLYAYNSKETALEALKEDAYWDNAEVFE